MKNIQASVAKLRREQLVMQYPFSKNRLNKLTRIAKTQGLKQFSILEFIKSVTGLTYSEIKHIFSAESPEQLNESLKISNGKENIELF